LANLIEKIEVPADWETHWNHFDGTKTEEELQALQNLLYVTYERVILQIGYYELKVGKQYCLSVNWGATEENKIIDRMTSYQLPHLISTANYWLLKVPTLKEPAKYKIVHDIAEECITVSPYEREEHGRILLVFEAEDFNEAMFIRNQFLQFEPYRPFGKIWFAKVGHNIVIGGKSRSKHNYEERTLIVLADDKDEAEKKLKAEAKVYSKPYKNVYDQEVSWKFDKIIELREADFFDTVELYKGRPVEIYDKRITKKNA
jgi:hypothetical protein